MSAFTGSAVESTAFVIALARAEESRRPDRLITDELAGEFVAAAGGSGAVPYSSLRATPVHQDFFAVRTRFFDDFVLGAGCRQVVLLGAGLDTRAHRLALPRDTRVFEVDLPAVLGFKAEVLTSAGTTPHCELVTVPADLTGDWAGALVRAGLRPGEPVAWVAEGLLFFLARSVQDAVLTTLTGLSAPGSVIGVEHVNNAFIAGTPGGLDLAEFARNGAEWQSGVDDPVAWLAGHGWAAEVVEPTDVARALGRDVPRPTRGDGAARVWFATGRR